MFEHVSSGIDSPATNVVLITPNNTIDLVNPIRGIGFGTEGTLKIRTVGGDIVTIPSGVLAAGVIHPIRISRVYATGTTVTDIIGVW